MIRKIFFLISIFSLSFAAGGGDSCIKKVSVQPVCSNSKILDQNVCIESEHTWITSAKVGLSEFADEEACSQAGGKWIGPPATWMSSWIQPTPGIFLWTLISFFIVLGILKWKAWGPLMKALDDREEKISSALDAASKAKEEAQKVSSDYEEMIAKAESEKQEILSQAKKDADTLRSKKESEVDAKCNDMLEKAKKEIDAERAKALKEIKSVAVNLSVDVASKIINKNLDSDDNRKIAEDTINSIN